MRLSVIPVDPTNAGPLAAWNGGDGEYWAENAALIDDNLRCYHRPFLDAAGITASDAVLDIGCGNGQTTCDAARLAGSGSALGVDLSTRMLAQARKRAAEQGIANVEFVQADAQIHPFEPASFDVAISRTGAMFFGDPVAAFSNIARALRPGGRLTLLVWDALAENHWVRDFLTALSAGQPLAEPPPGAPGPFSLAVPGHARNILTRAGWVDVTFEKRRQPTYFGATADEAYAFVCGLGVVRAKLGELGDADRGRAVADLRASIEAHLTPEGVMYPSAMWLIGARRPG